MRCFQSPLSRRSSSTTCHGEGGLSGNTVASYRDSFSLLLRWLWESEGLRPELVEVEDITPFRVAEFTKWLSDARGCSPATCNARVAALRSFARFAQLEEPAHLEACSLILEVPTARTPVTPPDHLTPEAVSLVVAAAERYGPRPHAAVSLLYDSAARVSELCSLRVGDVATDKPASVVLRGKGQKTRAVPVSPQVGTIVDAYVRTCREGGAASRPSLRERTWRPTGEGWGGIRPPACRRVRPCAEPRQGAMQVAPPRAQAFEGDAHARGRGEHRLHTGLPGTRERHDDGALREGEHKGEAKGIGVGGVKAGALQPLYGVGKERAAGLVGKRRLMAACYAKCRKAQTQVPVLRRLPLRITRCFALDDFMTTPIATQNAVDLFEVMEAREGRRATVIASQLEPNEWYLRIEGELMADSILNRIATGARYVDLEGPNMREYFAKRREEL